MDKFWLKRMCPSSRKFAKILANLIFSCFYSNRQKSGTEKKKLIKNVLLLFAMEILYSKGFRDSATVV